MLLENVIRHPQVLPRLYGCGSKRRKQPRGDDGDREQGKEKESSGGAGFPTVLRSNLQPENGVILTDVFSVLLSDSVFFWYYTNYMTF